MAVDTQNILAALMADILDIAKKENLGVFEFRRMRDLSGMGTTLAQCIGTPSEHRALESLINDAEYKAPTMHKALIDRAFDGQAFLQNKYRGMAREHAQLKRAAAGMEEAAVSMNVRRGELEAYENRLDGHAKLLEARQERLQLEASTRNINLDMPTLPQLPAKITNPDEESDDEELPPADSVEAANVKTQAAYVARAEAKETAANDAAARAHPNTDGAGHRD
jgi:hypothetical protein